MTLEPLSADHKSGFLKLVDDFLRNDPDTGGQLFGSKKWDEKVFAKFVKTCEAERRDWRPGPNKESVSHYVLRDGDDLCGYGRLRFPLPDGPNLKHGNLEFFVPPEKRGAGYGALTLNRLLFEAVRAGLARALVLCPADNGAAIKCIEKNRGVRMSDPNDSQWAKFWIRFR